MALLSEAFAPAECSYQTVNETGLKLATCCPIVWIAARRNSALFSRVSVYRMGFVTGRLAEALPDADGRDCDGVAM